MGEGSVGGSPTWEGKESSRGLPLTTINTLDLHTGEVLERGVSLHFVSFLEAAEVGV